MNNPIPQLAPAMALVELLREHPELQAASWRVDRDGLLSGTVAYDADHDMRPAMAAYAEVLGAPLSEQQFTSPQAKAECLSFTVFATWRDVKVNVWASCLVSTLAESSAVAA